MKNFDDVRNELKENDNATYIALEIVGSIMAARDRKKMSQRELSRISGVPQKTISRIENGIDIPRLDTMVELTEALGLKIELHVSNE